ncbi:hypothetical protein [Microvirga roseola]|uniref:hypothetical protein n=1 Tax=Microvirga roseola TaxID=2883126 RepID=UPI001E655208|nr:hypothetical protein [Microvirga roseola]
MADDRSSKSDQKHPPDVTKSTSEVPASQRSKLLPGQDNDPERSGYHHADTAMGTRSSEMMTDLEEAITGRTDRPSANSESGVENSPPEKV